jgi:hypothetical protein
MGDLGVAMGDGVRVGDGGGTVTVTGGGVVCWIVGVARKC